MQTQTYQDGFPMDAQAAINFSYFLSQEEKTEWSEWLQSANPEQQNELVDTLHAIWVENQKQVVPAGFDEKKTEKSAAAVDSQKSAKPAPEPQSKTPNKSQNQGSPKADIKPVTQAPLAQAPVNNTPAQVEEKTNTPQTATSSNKAGISAQEVTNKAQNSQQRPQEVGKNNPESEENIIKESTSKNKEVGQKTSPKNNSNPMPQPDPATTSAATLDKDARNTSQRDNRQKPQRSDTSSNPNQKQQRDNNVRQNQERVQNRRPERVDRRRDQQQRGQTRLEQSRNDNQRQYKERTQQQSQQTAPTSQRKQFNLSQAKVIATQQELVDLLTDYREKNLDFEQARVAYEQEVNNKQRAVNQSFATLMNKSMSILAQFEGVADYVEEMTEKLLQMNEVIKDQARINQQTRNDITNQVNDIQDGMDRVERDNTANYRDIKDLRGEIRKSVQEITEHHTRTEADSFGIEGMQRQIELLQAKIAKLEQNQDSMRTQEVASQKPANSESNIRKLDKPQNENTQTREVPKPRISKPTPKPIKQQNPRQNQELAPQPQPVKDEKNEDQSVIDLRDLI